MSARPNFKQQAAQKRAAVPQVDLESTKPAAVPVTPPPQPEPEPEPVYAPPPRKRPPKPATPPAHQVRITPVDTSEMPTNRGFSMYPSRHRQIAKDLAYLEDRKPWEIIDDALEEYVIRRYGKQFKRY